ncbi:MAG: FAD-dependent oxidoreductase [Coriobacteriales bacterium]|jgi:succinate dehydrogenase/fumarate reductase flavoprotein subunit|nr:FAD-dependent oxidoreductase [Coriobacteriales bacterium]
MSDSQKEEKKAMGQGMDRRSFLKGAVVAGGAAALAGLAACAPTGEGGGTGDAPSGGADGASTTNTRPWETKPAAITDATEGGDFDIIIIGAGISGNAAAEAASAKGAKVLVVEQAEEFTAHGVDCGHIGSKWQLENGIIINPDEAAKLVYRWSQQTANYSLIRTWAYRSGGVFDYLQELGAKSGLQMVPALSPTAKWGWEELEEVWREFPDAVSFIKEGDGMFTTDGQTVNYRIINALNEEALANGAEFKYKTHAEQLVQDASGKVTGVFVTDESGAHVQYNASKGVIMASGDISGNEAMLDAWAPICKRADSNMYTPQNGNLGDGLAMGLWAGAAYSKSPAAPMVHQIDMEGVLSAISMCWLAVNKNGKRYGAEMAIEPNITNSRMNQPGNISWSIFDSNYAQYVQSQFPTTYQETLNPLDFLTGEPTTVGAQLEAAIAAEHIVKADTLDDLATQLGIPVDAFKATVDRYNNWFESGVDGDFGIPQRFLTRIDTPPFFAQPIAATMLVCIFGLHVNDDSQVCDEDDNPIPGLFAIGNAQGDFFGNSYPVHCPGISHGRALTFGHLVGEALAQDTVITKTA